MNHLLLGTADKTQHLLSISKRPFLLIDDGPIADAFAEEFSMAKIFDPQNHSFNPLRGMDYKRARDFAETLYSASPQGENTLTVRNGKRALTKLLTSPQSRLDRLRTDASDPGTEEALASIDDLLLSPTLKRVLCGAKQFAFTGSIIARLDRAQLGDFDAFVLASLLIGQSKGQVIVPDFGFYGRALHVTLIRQNRLTAGLNFLAELSDAKLRQGLLSIKDIQGHGCGFEDAKLLADIAGIPAGTDGYGTFVSRVTAR